MQIFAGVLGEGASNDSELSISMAITVTVSVHAYLRYTLNMNTCLLLILGLVCCESYESSFRRLERVYIMSTVRITILDVSSS